MTFTFLNLDSETNYFYIFITPRKQNYVMYYRRYNFDLSQVVVHNAIKMLCPVSVKYFPNFTSSIKRQFCTAYKNADMVFL